MLTNAGGCACGTLWFGFAYLNNTPNHLIIWNMDDIATGKPEFYGWYDLDNKIDGINSEIEGINSKIQDFYYKKPEVPASDGTYTLKAVKAGDQITYNWVLDA